MSETICKTEVIQSLAPNQIGKKVLEQEAAVLHNLAMSLNAQFAKACHIICACKGRVVVTGIGKSGHIGRKIAATFASTGTPAFFMHAAEGLHGDLGMVAADDVILAISYSGQTSEVLSLLPTLRGLNCPIIAMTGEPNSTLANDATCHLSVQVAQEACHLGLAPTSSTTATLGMGDALAIAVSQMKGFSTHDFATSHPAGRLGKRLTLRVADVMHQGPALPVVQASDSIAQGLFEISQKALGMAAVMDNGKLVGVFTDGDLRRAVDRKYILEQTPFSEVMTQNPRTITPDMLLTTALKKMNECEINGFLVVDAQDKLIGAFNIRDIMRTGIV